MAKKAKRRRWVKRECPCGHCFRCTVCGEWVPKLEVAEVDREMALRSQLASVQAERDNFEAAWRYSCELANKRAEAAETLLATLREQITSKAMVPDHDEFGNGYHSALAWVLSLIPETPKEPAE